MRARTLRDHLARGGADPMVAQGRLRSSADRVGAPLGLDEVLPTLARFPGPAALRRLLRGESGPTLHAEGVDRAFAGTIERTFAWPGVDRMGAILLLDPWALSPVRAAVLDAYLVDATVPLPFERTFYAPDLACARAAGEATTFAEARERVPADWPERCDEALGRIDAHIRRVLALREGLDALAALSGDERAARFAEHGIEAADLLRPTFLLEEERLRGLEAAARGMLIGRGAGL